MKYEKYSLGILTIATNVYIDYWEDMVMSLDSNLEYGQKCVAHVFTEQTERANIIAKKLKKVSVQVHEIQGYRWPDATIRRYEVFSKFSNLVDQDVVMHLDADMIILENVYIDLIDAVKEKDVALIAHPGFWNRRFTWIARIRDYFFWSRSIYGSWETRRKSEAYVNPKSRKPYVCGGIWLGKNQAIFELIKQLAKSVEIDRNNSIMAVWHDESHLNQWASKNDFALLSPEFCFVNEFEHLKQLRPKVLAVTKKIKTR
jgi:hypothetical protein